MRRVVRTAAAAALVGAVALTGASAQAADDGGNGLLRLAHLSPDTPAVDVYVDAVSDPDAGITLEGVGYGAVSEYQDVPPGEYTVSMREAGAGEEAPPVLSTTVQVEGGGAARWPVSGSSRTWGWRSSRTTCRPRPRTGHGCASSPAPRTPRPSTWR